MIFSVLLSLILTAGENNLPDGTLWFIEGGSKVVRNHTESSFSHVGIIINHGGTPYLYEAVRPVVRAVPVSQALKEIEQHNARGKEPKHVWIMRPKFGCKLNDMSAYLKSQVGKRYSIASYIHGKPHPDTIHCAELVTNALLKGGYDIYGEPCRMTPNVVMQYARKWYEAETTLQDAKS